MQHRAQDVKDRAITEVHLDYCFMGSEESEGKSLTILVARERDGGMTCSTVVPRKGALDSFASKRVLAFIREIGCEFNSVIIKSDQESASRPAMALWSERYKRCKGFSGL